MEHILNRNFGINNIIGSVFLAILCYFIFIQDVKKIAKINSITIPMLIILIIYIGVKNLFTINVFNIEFNAITDNSIFWIIEAILYASYNLIILIPVLINLKQFIKNKKQILIISILTGIVISIMSLLVFFLLKNVDVSFSSIEMPIIYVIKKCYPKFSIIYGCIVLIAIFSTAISVGKAFLNNISKDNTNCQQIAVIMCITSIGFSFFGFSNLVKILFPIFGYLGIAQIFLINKI